MTALLCRSSASRALTAEEIVLDHGCENCSLLRIIGTHLKYVLRKVDLNVAFSAIHCLLCAYPMQIFICMAVCPFIAIVFPVCDHRSYRSFRPYSSREQVFLPCTKITFVDT